ncbi:haloacid dehalogenase type II [Actinomadura rayongensis]|uniref:haloacid dehalogenase type II n=1 Tax=Actinomadura rayongensis TaxID=1429076 RepID=UPI00301CE335
MEPKEIDVVLFDVFGTLTDWWTSVSGELADAGAAAGIDADWPAVTTAWRRHYRPAIHRALAGDLSLRSTDALHRFTLDAALADHGVTGFGDADRAGLVRAWHRLRPWPDAAPGLERLHAGRLVTGTLSNGGVGLLTRLAKRAGLRFDCVLSAELAGTFKPDPRVYRRAAELLDVEPRRILLTACHPDDLEAAAGTAFRTAYLPRPYEWGPDARPVDPPAGVDLIVSDVLALARALAD